MKPIYRSYLIEVNLGAAVPGVGSNLYIKDYPTLRDVWFCGVTSHTNQTLAKSPAGADTITATGEQQIAATFVDRYNQEIIKSYPCRDLVPYYVSGFYRDFKPFQLQLTKSYITILNTTGLSANQSILLNVFYYTNKDIQAFPRK
jgi:hypothetical protein